MRGNVFKPAEAQGIIDAAVKTFGRLDILVNNSGVYEFGPIEAITGEFSQDVRYQCPRRAARYAGCSEAHERGWQHYQHRFRGQPHSAGELFRLHATKASVDAITGVLSKELGPKKIRVNSVNPGIVETEGIHPRALLAPILRKASLPRHRWGGQVSRTTLRQLRYFSLRKFSWLTGESIIAGGGFTDARCGAAIAPQLIELLA